MTTPLRWLRRWLTGRDDWRDSLAHWDRLERQRGIDAVCWRWPDKGRS